jgi:hypothetical protein
VILRKHDGILQFLIVSTSRAAALALAEAIRCGALTVSG